MYQRKVDVDMLNALYSVQHIHINLKLIHCVLEKSAAWWLAYFWYSLVDKIQHFKTHSYLSKPILITCAGTRYSYPVPHSKHRLVVADPSPQPFIAICNSKNCKTTGPKVENEILNIVHVQCSLHLLKARTTMDDIFLSHSYILVFPPNLSLA